MSDDDGPGGMSPIVRQPSGVWKWICPECQTALFAYRVTIIMQNVTEHMRRSHGRSTAAVIRRSRFNHEQLSMTQGERVKFDRQYREAVADVFEDEGFWRTVNDAYEAEHDRESGD